MRCLTWMKGYYAQIDTIFCRFLSVVDHHFDAVSTVMNVWKIEKCFYLVVWLRCFILGLFCPASVLCGSQRTWSPLQSILEKNSCRDGIPVRSSQRIRQHEPGCGSSAQRFLLHAVRRESPGMTLFGKRPLFVVIRWDIGFVRTDDHQIWSLIRGLPSRRRAL